MRASNPILVAAFAVCTAFLGVPALAADHNESVDGDLSSNANAPTPLSFDLGTNTITGTVVSPADVRDYITFTLPAGTNLSALRLIQYNAVGGGPGNRGWAGFNAGATSCVPSFGTSGNFLGGTHVDAIFAGTDILPMIAIGEVKGVLGYARGKKEVKG